MSMNSFVFLSHSGKDDSTADRIFEELVGKGVKCWRDHTDILAGDNWSRKIETALADCEGGLLLLTQAAATSDACQAEYLTLIESSKVLYVAVSGGPDIPWRLRTFQFVFLDADFSLAIEKLASSIKEKRTILTTATPKEVEAGMVGTLVPFSHSILRRARFVLDMALEQFLRIADQFVRFIARLLGLDDDDIDMIDIAPGSTVVTIQLPELAAFQIVDIADREPQIFSQYRLVSATSFRIPASVPVQASESRLVAQETTGGKFPHDSKRLDSELLALQESSFSTFPKFLARLFSGSGGPSLGASQLLSIYRGMKGIRRGDVEGIKSILEKLDPRWRR